MDIDRLRYFIAVNDSETMKEASELLHISQPALSKAMKLLESELGEQLFIHSGRRVLITDAGKMIAEKARKILADLEKITLNEKEITDPLIKIGSFEVFTTYFMGQLIGSGDFDHKVQLREYSPGALEESIVNRVVDFGITYLPVPHPDLEFIKVHEIDMGIFGLKKHFSATEFKDLPFTVPVNPVMGSPSKVKGLDGWPDNKIPRLIKYQVELMETALEFCRQGQSVAYLPSFVIALHNEQVKSKYVLTELSLPKKFKKQKQGIYLVKRKVDKELALFRKIAHYLRKI
mgnify:CR=1 FL=1|tara:strand:- start:219866 stop:220732 length:867 start_codon:yes stop_codon:yes gene_type:complete